MFVSDFPILAKVNVKGQPVAYLDSAATTQKPVPVLNEIHQYYTQSNANPHRGVYDLSVESTNRMEAARQKAAGFIGAAKSEEIIFTKSATEALNLVAYCYGMQILKKGEQIVLSISEHHSNLVPWQIAAKATGAELVYLLTDAEGRISGKEIQEKITHKARIVAIAHVSNVTGVIYPLEEIIRHTHKMGGTVVVDGTQGVPHLPVNVGALDADFYVFSGHKMLAPMGIGVLYGKKRLLDAMPPFLYGGDMINYVEKTASDFAAVPQKFEGGTQNIGGAVGLMAAIGYLEKIGFPKLMEINEQLTGYLLEKLSSIPYVHILGPLNTDSRIGIVSFVMEDVHPHDVATIVNADNIAIRSGNHCAQPFHAHMGYAATCRASLYVYNTVQDIDRLADSLKGVRRWLGYGS